jgi:hypothetical protein
LRPGGKGPSKLFDFEEDGNFIDLMRKWIQEGVEEAEQRNHFDQISSRSSLYSIFRRIEEMHNRGEKAKIDMIKALLDAFEIGEGTSRINPIKDRLEILKTPPEKNSQV